MAALFVAYNCAIDATTGMMAGTSYATGAKCAIQLVPASGEGMLITEIGISFSGTTAAAPSVVTLAAASAAATGLTAHSTSSVLQVGSTTKTSTLQMGTALSGYGAVGIVTNTTNRQYWGALVGTMTQYEKQYPLGRDYFMPNGSFLQLRVNTAATLTAIAYVVYEES
jgi:hypothetical protein